MAWIRKQLGPAALEQMLAENTRRLLAGEMPETRRARLSALSSRYFSSHRRGAPSSTESPSLTSTADTFPAAGDSTGISIFIDSRMTTVWPSLTVSPTLTSIFQTVPVMCALTGVAMARESTERSARAVKRRFGIDAAM